jgi:hypothetical protein
MLRYFTNSIASKTQLHNSKEERRGEGKKWKRTVLTGESK